MPTPAHRWQARAAYLTSGYFKSGEPLIRELRFDQFAELAEWLDDGPDQTALVALYVTFSAALPQPLSDEEVARLAVAA